MIQKAKDFVRQSRTMFLTCTLVPVVLGGAAAYDYLGSFDWALFLLVLIGVGVAHWGVNLSNDYYDYISGTDRVQDSGKPYSGGGDAITRDGISPETVRLWFWCCFSFAFGTGVAILLMVDRGAWLIALIMFAGFLGGYGYTAPPLKLAYRGLGELDIFFFLGPAPALGVFSVLTGTLNWTVVVCSVPVAGLIAALLWINEYTDYEDDREAGKLNLVVRLGPKKARWGFAFLAALVFGSIVYAVAAGIVTAWFLLPLVMLPIAARSVWRAITSWNDMEAIKKSQGEFLLVHLVAGLLCAVGLLLGTVG